MTIKNIIATLAMLVVILGCAGETIDHRDLDTSEGRNLELYINPQATSRAVSMMNYNVTGLSLQLISAEPAWITNFYWQASSEASSFTVNAQNPGQYTLKITHHGINGSEPINVTETFNFELVPMTITRLVIVPGQIGIIDMGTTPSDTTNGSNPGGSYTNDTTITNTTGPYTNEPPATNTTNPYTNEPPTTNTTNPYTNEPPTTNTTNPYTNEPPTTNTTNPYTNEPPTTNTTNPYTNEPPATNTTNPYTNEPPATNTTNPYTNEPPATNTTQTNG